MPARVRSRLSRAFAMPKSSSFTMPSYATITFFWATSLWTMGLCCPEAFLNVCAACSARHTSRITATLSHSGMGCWRRSYAAVI
jgi:hypothetical protein